MDAFVTTLQSFALLTGSHVKMVACIVAALYLCAAFLAWQVKLVPDNATANPTSNAKISSQQYSNPWTWRFLCLAVAWHTALLFATLYASATSNMLNLGFAQALSITACVGVLLYLIESCWLKMDGLLPFVLSLPIIAVPLAAWVAPTPVQIEGWAAVHVVVAIVAHGLALLACGHALLLLALNGVLKNQYQGRWAQQLSQQSPPLVVLERLLIRLCWWVAALLILTTGLAWWAGWVRWNHKTVFTLLSLLCWMTIPMLYHRYAWRSTRLLAAVFTATGLLLMAYIGSRFVLQAILHRSI